MKSSYVPPVITTFTALEMAQAYEIALDGDGKVPAGEIAVLCAHCTLEVGRDVKRGVIGTGCHNWEPGNIKASASWEGLYTAFTLNEYLVESGVRRLIWFAPQGRLKGGPGTELVPPLFKGPPTDDWHPQTRMRAHDCLADGIRYKVAFLKQPRFAKALAFARLGDAAGYVNAIHEQRYFTANLEPYRSAVVSIAKTMIAVAQRIADQPILLPPLEEAHIDKVIKAHAQAPSMLADDIPWLPLDPDWDAQRRARDAAVRDMDE
jgi:hypothetical protein